MFRTNNSRMSIRIPLVNVALANPSDDPGILQEFRPESQLENKVCQKMLENPSDDHGNQEFQTEFQFWPTFKVNLLDDHGILIAANTTINNSDF